MFWFLFWCRYNDACPMCLQKQQTRQKGDKNVLIWTTIIFHIPKQGEVLPYSWQWQKAASVFCTSSTVGNKNWSKADGSKQNCGSPIIIRLTVSSLQSFNARQEWTDFLKAWLSFDHPASELSSSWLEESNYHQFYFILNC